MDYISDILLAAGAIGAGFYCFILGRRLKKFNSLEKGVGGAVAVLSSQVDELSAMLTAAQKTAAESSKTLSDLSERAERTSRKLEMQMASLHDLPDTPPEAPKVEQTPETVGQPLFTRRASGAN